MFKKIMVATVLSSVLYSGEMCAMEPEVNSKKVDDIAKILRDLGYEKINQEARETLSDALHERKIKASESEIDAAWKKVEAVNKKRTDMVGILYPYKDEITKDTYLFIKTQNGDLYSAYDSTKDKMDQRSRLLKIFDAFLSQKDTKGLLDIFGRKVRFSKTEKTINISGKEFPLANITMDLESLKNKFDQLAKEIFGNSHKAVIEYLKDKRYDEYDQSKILKKYLAKEYLNNGLSDKSTLPVNGTRSRIDPRTKEERVMQNPYGSMSSEIIKLQDFVILDLSVMENYIEALEVLKNYKNSLIKHKIKYFNLLSPEEMEVQDNNVQKLAAWFYLKGKEQGL